MKRVCSWCGHEIDEHNNSMTPSAFAHMIQNESAIPISHKVRVERYRDPCCPHCAYVFPEHGGPWPKDRQQLDDALHNKIEFHEVIWECPQCSGEIVYPESGEHTDWLRG